MLALSYMTIMLTELAHLKAGLFALISFAAVLASYEVGYFQIRNEELSFTKIKGFSSINALSVWTFLILFTLILSTILLSFGENSSSLFLSRFI